MRRPRCTTGSSAVIGGGGGGGAVDIHMRTDSLGFTCNNSVIII